MSTVASFGGNLKVFTYNNGHFEQSGCHTYKSNAQKLRGGHISWADSYMVCAFEETGVIPVFTNRNSILSVLKRPIHHNASTASFFNWTNRSLVLGGYNGAVSIWDIKDGKSTLEFSTPENSPVKFLSVNCDDSYIAAARSTSVVRLYSCTTNCLSSTLKLDAEEEFTSLKFSPAKKNYLGCSTMDGSVIVWDTNPGVVLTHLKNVSPSACSGIVFSPTNSTVLISVSLSQVMKVHDIRQKKTVFEINMGKSLTCVDMLINENVVLMGTMDGYILDLDLRTSAQLEGVLAHSERVVSLQAVKSRSTNKGKHFNDVQINTPDEPSPKHNDVSFNDIFSPLNPSTLLGNTPNNQSMIQRRLSAVSPMEPSFQKWEGLQKSTPNAGNFVDSFMAQMLTPEQKTVGSESQSPSPSTVSSVSIPNDIEMPENLPITNGISHSESSSSDGATAVLKEISETLKTVSAELSNVQKSVDSLSAELADVKRQQEKDRSLLLDIYDLSESFPYMIRMDTMLHRQ